MGRFQQAKREKLRLRFGIDGPSGSGKSFSALRIGMLLADHFKTKMAVIEAGENGGMLCYKGDSPDGIPIDFDYTILTDFSPREYTDAINEAGKLGYGVIIIDSLSHAWAGKGGALDTQGKIADQGGNSWTAWRSVTPMHNAMIDAILQSPAHVFATLRVKTEHVQEKDEVTKKTVIREVGVAPIQREGMKYEFTTYGSMDINHILRITKTRGAESLDNAIIPRPGKNVADHLIAWLEKGESSQVGEFLKANRISQDQQTRIIELIVKLGRSPDDAEKSARRKYKCGFIELTPFQANEVIGYLEHELNERQAKEEEAKQVVVKEDPAPAPAPAPEPTKEPISNSLFGKDHISELTALGIARGWSATVIADRLKRRFGVMKVEELTQEQAKSLLDEIASKEAQKGK